MRKRLLVLAGSALILAAAGCGGGQSGGGQTEGGQTGTGTATGGATAQAESLFKSTCASCHGQDLSGGLGPDLRQVGARLSEDEILSIIENGKGTMPGGLLKGDDAKAVAAWLAEKK
ncbi:cytochrome c551 [Hydrogenibacillus schlegelii]|nr:cytochrome c [Hydrogenibacillus schlegelii]KWX07731.1 hypothetical protein TR75_02250 [Hydrogenibacillus schlegelii]OAR03264.1 hypothetical protein SA87_05035 [Hydrogenibacillus schlegelii]